mmetsp:Transcript_12279/g.17882  ORF Transcript_12279/g.17882 Transcript_12279/m.17882 type:complete len:291 (+) Transcript_12279:19-891(+)
MLDEASYSYKRKHLKLNIPKINSSFSNLKTSSQRFEDHCFGGTYYGVSSKKGLRPTMQDSYCVVANSSVPSFGVYDGHLNSQASSFAAKNLQSLVSTFSQESLIRAFKLTDSAFCNEYSEGGTTAGVLLVQEGWLLAANAGDTGILLVSSYGEEFLSQVHKPQSLQERAYIESRKGFITQEGSVHRVNGVLAVTRCIGNPQLKPVVHCYPFVQKKELGKDDLVAVIASDGLFSKISGQDVGDFVRKYRELAMKDLAEALVQEAIKRGSRDNITIITVDLLQFLKMEQEFS